MTVVTRFAPSPTGYLHIGGARTALFNWLFAKHTGGKFLLRIEDTDRARSTDDAIQAILDGLKWMGLDWDGEPVFQFARADKHRAAAERLLAEGKAYRCYATPEELTALREEQKAKGVSIRYDGRWRDRVPNYPPDSKPFVIRFKAPQEGETVIHDLVQGPVTVANAQLDDMVLLRADGTPTYMLAVVVDDIEMGITHVIRGDDHLNNAFRQLQLILALGHAAPTYAHIPLIHGPDGAKLSKRHGALGIEAYRDMGFLPEALRNYLARLGWSHGDDEIFSDAQAIEWFDIKDVNKGAARLDLAKLTALNGHYVRTSDNARLVEAIAPSLQQKIQSVPSAIAMERLTRGMTALKQRAKTLLDLADSAAFYVRPRPLALDAKAAAALTSGGAEILRNARASLENIDMWATVNLEEWAKVYGEQTGKKLGDIAQPLRAALCGALASPPIFEVMEILGKAETLGRIGDAVGP